MTKFTALLEDLQKATSRLEEVLKIPKTDIVRDSAIQRFEIVFDLGWKTLKAFLEEYHNVSCFSPRSCFKEAFRQQLIDYEPFWIKITSVRNYTTHTYSQVLAEKVYASLPEALEHFKKLLEVIKRQKSDL